MLVALLDTLIISKIGDRGIEIWACGRIGGSYFANLELERKWTCVDKIFCRTWILIDMVAELLNSPTGAIHFGLVIASYNNCREKCE